MDARDLGFVLSNSCISSLCTFMDLCYLVLEWTMSICIYRDLLAPASGFQSLQFRILECRLGLPMVWHTLKIYMLCVFVTGVSSIIVYTMDNMDLSKSVLFSLAWPDCFFRFSLWWWKMERSGRATRN